MVVLGDCGLMFARSRSTFSTECRDRVRIWFAVSRVNLRITLQVDQAAFTCRRFLIDIGSLWCVSSRSFGHSTLSMEGK